MIDERDPLIALDFDAAVVRHVLHQETQRPTAPGSQTGRPLIVPDWDPYKIFQ